MDDALSPAARGSRLCQAMKVRGLEKLCALAVAMQVSESAISRWRHGGPITLDNAVLLCSALDISLDWLMLGRGRLDGASSISSDRLDSAYLRLPNHVRDKLDALVAALVDVS